MRLPTVFFAEGGGGRPGDTDYPVVSALDTRAFALWAKLSGLVPRIAIVHGRCFAGNAVIAGCADLIVATENASLGMGGPAMIAGGGLGEVDPDAVGPIAIQAPQRRRRRRRRRRGRGDRGDEEAARLLPGARPRPAPNPTRRGCASWSRSAQRRAYDPAPIVETLADEGSVTFLRERFAPEMVTALARIEGRPLGFVANDTRHIAGAITSDASDKAARLPAALRRLRAAGRLARRHARLHGRARGRGDRPGPPRLAAAGRRRGAAGAADRGGPAARLRPRRPGDGRRQPARAAADGRLAERPPRADGPGGGGAAGAAQGARGDRRRGRARAARPRPHRRRRRERQGAQRGGPVRARRRHRPGRDPRPDRRDPGRGRAAPTAAAATASSTPGSGEFKCP